MCQIQIITLLAAKATEIGGEGGGEKRKSKSKSGNLLAMVKAAKIGGEGGGETRKRKSVTLLVAAVAEIGGKWSGEKKEEMIHDDRKRTRNEKGSKTVKSALRKLCMVENEK